MSFIKKGDFNSLLTDLPDDSSLERKCEYFNTNPSYISEVSIFAFCDGYSQIRVRMLQGFDSVLSSLKATGFPDDLLYGDTVSILHKDPNILANFLMAIEKAAPEICELEREICLSLGFNLLNIKPLPRWYKEGDFNIKMDTSEVSILERTCEYFNSQSPYVKNITICGYSNDEFQIRVRAPNYDAYHHMCSHMNKLGFPPKFPADFYNNTCTVFTSDRYKILQFLDEIEKFEPTFREIESEVRALFYPPRPSISVDRFFSQSRRVTSAEDNIELAQGLAKMEI